MGKGTRPRRRRSSADERRMLRLLSRALEQLEALDDPASVAPVPGEPPWVEQLAPAGRAFSRLLLLEAGRPARQARRTL